jgi:hypothetical protein
MLVFDRGYCDYGWFANLTARRVHFVTRLKDNGMRTANPSLARIPVSV